MHVNRTEEGERTWQRVIARTTELLHETLRDRLSERDGWWFAQINTVPSEVVVRHDHPLAPRLGGQTQPSADVLRAALAARMHRELEERAAMEAECAPYTHDPAARAVIGWARGELQIPELEDFVADKCRTAEALCQAVDEVVESVMLHDEIDRPREIVARMYQVSVGRGEAWWERPAAWRGKVLLRDPFMRRWWQHEHPEDDTGAFVPFTELIAHYAAITEADWVSARSLMRAIRERTSDGAAERGLTIQDRYVGFDWLPSPLAWPYPSLGFACAGAERLRCAREMFDCDEEARGRRARWLWMRGEVGWNLPWSGHTMGEISHRHFLRRVRTWLTTPDEAGPGASETSELMVPVSEQALGEIIARLGRRSSYEGLRLVRSSDDERVYLAAAFIHQPLPTHPPRRVCALLTSEGDGVAGLRCFTTHEVQELARRVLGAHWRRPVSELSIWDDTRSWHGGPTDTNTTGEDLRGLGACPHPRWHWRAWDECDDMVSLAICGACGAEIDRTHTLRIVPLAQVGEPHADLDDTVAADWARAWAALHDLPRHSAPTDLAAAQAHFGDTLPREAQRALRAPGAHRSLRATLGGRR